MVEQNVPNFEVAYNAMRAQQLEEQLTSAKETPFKNIYKVRKRRRWKYPGVTGLVSMNQLQILKWRVKEHYNDYDQQTNKFKEVSYLWVLH